MSSDLTKEDCLKLWMYFEDRADKVKEAMFKTLTWTIGFAAGLQGFIFFNLVEFEAAKASVPLAWLVIVSAAAGIVICLYSWFMLSESGKHIQHNWDRAKVFKEQRPDVAQILSGIPKKKGGMKIWNQLRIIVALFAVAFALVLAWGIKAA